MRFSTRVQRLHDSPTISMSETVAKRFSRDETVVRFDIGEPDFETPAHIKEAGIEAIRQGFTHYTSARGIPELRDALAADLRAVGLDAEPSNITVYPGSKFGLFAVLSLMIDAGDEVVIQDPVWPTYASQIEYLGGRPVRLESSDGQRPSEFPIGPLDERISERTKVVIINSPCNPTGARISERRLEEILALTSRRKVVLLLDRIYSSIVYEGAADRVPSSELEDDDLIMVNGFSKEFAMTGWRIGYAVASRTYTDMLVRFQDNTTTCAPSFVQKAALAGLTGDRTWQREMNREYKERRDTMVNEIGRIQGWHCSPPQGAFYCFPGTPGRDSASLASALLEKEKVSTMAGVHFGPGGEGHLRLSFATPKGRIVEGMRRVREFVDQRSSEEGSGGEGA